MTCDVIFRMRNIRSQIVRRLPHRENRSDFPKEVYLFYNGQPVLPKKKTVETPQFNIIPDCHKLPASVSCHNLAEIFAHSTAGARTMINYGTPTKRFTAVAEKV
jgi:hypothetical protein